MLPGRLRSQHARIGNLAGAADVQDLHIAIVPDGGLGGKRAGW
jgi:hypothetical protein